MKIEPGHIVRNFIDHRCYSAVVLRVDKLDTKVPQFCYLVYISKDKSFEKFILPTDEYKEFQVVNIGGMTTTQNLDRLKRLYEESKRTKWVRKSQKKVSRLQTKPIVEGIKPNTKYDDGTQVFVETQGKWKNLVRTSEKMAFFEKGRCRMDSITQVLKPGE